MRTGAGHPDVEASRGGKLVSPSRKRKALKDTLETLYDVVPKVSAVDVLEQWEKRHGKFESWAKFLKDALEKYEGMGALKANEKDGCEPCNEVVAGALVIQDDGNVKWDD